MARRDTTREPQLRYPNPQCGNFSVFFSNLIINRFSPQVGGFPATVFALVISFSAQRSPLGGGLF